MIPNYDLVLASQSPRRQELLKAITTDFTVHVKPIDESFPDDMPVNQVAGYIAKQKASAFESELKDNQLLITSDTIVVNNDRILGKPADFDEGFAMLKELSGKVHEVQTAICLTSTKKQQIETETTKVFFRDLSDDEITHYLNNFKPYDKAGGYGIQDWIGKIAITRIEGDYYNVVGLPVTRLMQMFKENWM